MGFKTLDKVERGDVVKIKGEIKEVKLWKCDGMFVLLTFTDFTSRVFFQGEEVEVV